jgi:hypothetical protein
MRDLNEQDPQSTNNSINQNFQNQALYFITAGIGCNCLISIKELGLFDTFISKNCVTVNDINSTTNAPLAYSALYTLESCHIVKKNGYNFELTDLGIALSNNLGLVSMLFDGYADLIAHQTEISQSSGVNCNNLIRGKSVSQSAVTLAKSTFDPVLLREVSLLEFSGAICDLGCGYGRMLSQLCEHTGNSGIGFDSEPTVVKEAAKTFEKTNISIHHADITKIDGTWEKVNLLLQCHVFHDFNPAKNCIETMNSYLNNFPNLRYFLYLDTVGPSSSHPSILPGFDYVHGLQGFLPRTYEETINIFTDSKYDMVKEVKIPHLPNTFLWILTPKGKSDENI